MILILPTQYGKSLAVAIGVLLRAAIFNEKWAIIAPSEEKARIIMDYIIEHVFDHSWLVKKLDYTGTKQQLMQHRAKDRLTFRGAGEIRVYSADATNTQKTTKALMGFGSPNIVLDESPQTSDDLYATIKRMLGGTKDNFLLEIGNPFNRRHFYRMWISKLYKRIFLDAEQALLEGRYTRDYLDEMKEEAFYDVLYECHFPEDDQAPNGYRRLLSDTFIERALIPNDLPLGHNTNGSLLDKPILGIDPNHGGSNFTDMVVRFPLTGFAKLVLHKQYADDKSDITGEIIADAEKIIEEYGIDDWRIAVDVGGVGAGVGDGLSRKGYGVEKVLFGQKPANTLMFANRKAELDWRLRKWIRADNGKLVMHDGFLQLKEINYKENSSSKVQMESKDKLAKRGVASPDTHDALILTFIDVRVDDDDDYAII